MKKSKTNIDTGRLLNNFLKKNKISKAELGRDINRSGKSILNYIKNSSLQTGILIEICHATKHNFFQDIANEMPPEFTVSKKDQMIDQLQKELDVLRIQNELLMKLKG